MKIYDISQEVFSSEVYPSDPVPKSNKICSMDRGDLYNLSEFSMCAHNGTHVDAPLHFIKNGNAVDKLELSHLVGNAYVVSHSGFLDSVDADNILSRVKREATEACRRLLIKGDATVTEAAAQVFANEGIFLIGVESQSVGPIDAPMTVHQILLGKGVILLEGLRLDEVSDGRYILCAAPLKLAGLEGAPCRAVLIEV